MVHWAGKGSSQVICLARDPEMTAGSTSNIFLSKDYGKTFQDISHRFTIDGKTPATLEKLYSHPESKCHYVLTDVVNRFVFGTDDCWKTVFERKLPDDITPSKIYFDERVDKTFLIHDLVSEEKNLHVTRDFGVTFSLVSHYVKTFHLSYDEEATTTIFLQRFKPGSHTTSIISSPNYMERHIDTRVVYNDAIDFEKKGQYMFVTSKSGDVLDLKVSVNGEKFVKAIFDGETSTGKRDYHVVDVTDEGQIMVVVNHDEVLSNLYVSTSLSHYEVRFSLSLERVVFYSPQVTWADSWLGASAGDEPFVDVYKVEGLRGIYIASQLTPDAFKDSKSGKLKHLQPSK